ncbi:hypothetical protein C0Q70_00516 [Pomacea canaliculata]|uniref:Uncharacterized protein n=1 Tax=Pomacea canaliculata TaxID=400727 RepID=A0A2T7PWW7_POMCA|nr:hypothetical protein C0Q70_00516 [Pomacea canaliculata]
MLQEYPSCLQTCDDYKRNEQMKALEQIKNLTEKLEITTKQLHEAVQINAVLNKSISTLKYKVETEIKNITEQLTNTINQLQEKVQRNAVLNKSISTLKYKGETEIKNITEQLTNTTNQLQEKEKHNDEMATQLRKVRRSCAENRRNPEPVPMENTSLPDHLPQQNGSYRLLLQKDESALSANGCLAKEAQQKNVSEAASPLLVDQLSDDVDIVTETQERENVDNTELKQELGASRSLHPLSNTPYRLFMTLKPARARYRSTSETKASD